MALEDAPATPLPDTVRMRLLAVCPDKVGIVATAARCIADSGANIESSHQFSADPPDGMFFLRMEFTAPFLAYTELRRAFKAQVADRFGMTWQIRDVSERKRIAILVSRQEHCLTELLWRWRRDELDGEIVLVASNHADLRSEAEALALPYRHIPVTKENRADAEASLLDVLDGECDLVVLARYMQILSGDFLERVGVPIINIHQSFLPAFPGPSAYVQAHRQGVKLIGATAHYVTEELDAGPIIEQDVIRVTHEDDVTSLERLGAQIERSVLARAVHWHCQDRVLRHGNTTVVFA